MSIKRIIISEADKTTNGVVVPGTDIVYVPGFACSDGVAMLEDPRVPTLCTTITDFKSKFGSKAPKFALHQYYKKADVNAEGEPITKGFLPNAVPDSLQEGESIWFTGASISGGDSGDKDPAWTYAYELILSGIPVVYERMNEKNDFPNDIPMFDGKLPYAVGDKVVGPTYATAESGAEYLARYDYYECIKEVEAPAGEEPENKINPENWSKLDENSIYDVTVDKMYECLCSDVFSIEETNYLMDRGSQQAKYITTGGYPNFEYYGGEELAHLANVMAKFAAERGDCVSFIDHTNKPNRNLIGVGSVFDSISNKNKIVGETDTGIGPDNEKYIVKNASFATMITPWSSCNTVGSGIQNMPGSFAYFMAMLNPSSSMSRWSPVAGPSRGRVNSITKLLTTKRLTNTIADSYQQDLGSSEAGGVSINAITEILPYGYCIYGNRTLVERVSGEKGFATTFLNLRNLVSDVKKRVHLASRTYMFEQNTDILWVNFKSQITPLLDSMVTNNVLSNYKVIQLETDDQTKISARVFLYTRYAVESFDVNIVLADSDDDTLLQ